MTRFALVLLLVACGGAQRPKSSGMKELAAEIDAEAADVARIVHDLRADCPRLASELKAVFARMTKSFDRARTAQQDPALAKELTMHMRAYDDAAKKRDAAIEADIVANPACISDPTVRDTMLAMPTL